MGEANGSVNIKNSIYAPDTFLQQDEAAISGSGSATFVRGGSATMTNCYYTHPLGTAQGKQAHTITADENVTIDYGTATDIYSVITAYGTGLAYNDNFYAGEGDEVTLTLDNTPPTGYKLKNYTVDHGTLNGNILTMPNESVKAGAVFDPITYTVAFDKNHSDASGTMNAQHFTYNESRNLTENGFTAPKDYRFAGWATSPDGTAEYGNGAEVKNLTAADGTTVTLYAKWEAPNYSILKNSTHGTITAKVGETENALTAHYNDTVILTVQPDAGYWLKKLIVMDADGNEVPVNDNKFTMPDGDVTVSAAFDNSDECAFDEETGTLHLRGNVDKSDVQQYKDKAVYVVAEEGTVLPEDCGAMFDTFKKVQSIDLKKADTSAVTDMSFMFSGCSGLTDLDVSSFDTSAVTDMSSIFDSCEKLANLDVSSFDTSNVNNMSFMFNFCIDLTTIYVSDNWNIQAFCESQGMFENCGKLVGGNQTRWDNSYTDACYAVIDGKDEKPGYLTSAENLYALRLPDNMEIVFVMPSKNKVGGRYLYGTEVSFKAKEYYNASNVKANEILLTEGNGIYHILVICDTIVTAELEEQTFTVTFNSSGGTAVESQTVAYNKMANEPETPSKELCTFDGWYIGDTKFDFRTPITSDIDLTAHWTEKTVNIKFKGVSGAAVKTLQIHAKNGSFADVSEQIEIPSASYLDGYTFTGWTLNGTKYNTDQQDSLITALADLAAQNGATDNDIIVNEVYEQKDGQFTVEVKNGIIRNGGPTGTFKPSDEVYVTAAGGSEGQQFSYWTKKAKNSETSPVIVSYEENYVFRMPSSDTELQAVYGELLPDGKVGTAYIESVTKTGDNMVSFVSILSVPDDATMLKAGIVACKASDLKDGHDAPDINYARFRKYNETTCRDYKAFKYTWTKSNIGDGDVWCVRAYLLYSDKDGVQHDVYGEMVKADKNGKVEEISQ